MDSSTASHLLQEAVSSLVMDHDEKKIVLTPKEQAINCPRCNSTETKFCYYNNYSLSQPRYFCKTCRRYWTRGGTLKSVPVGGGGSKKNKKSSSSTTSTSSTTPTSSDEFTTNTDDDQVKDLNLSFITSLVLQADDPHDDVMNVKSTSKCTEP